MTNIEKQGLSTRELKASIASAIGGMELAYPLFKPTVEVIAYWSGCLMKIDFKPEDITNGAERLMGSGIEAFKIDLGRLTRHCRDAMSERVRKEHRAFKKMESQKPNILDIQGKSLYAQEMMKLMQEVEKYKNDGKMNEFWDKRKEIMEKYSIEGDEES